MTEPSVNGLGETMGRLRKYRERIVWRKRRSWECIRKRESLIGWFCYPKEIPNLTQISNIKNHSIPNSLLKTESKPKPKCNPIHSNPIQSNTIKIPRPKSYLNPNLKNQKIKTKTDGGYGSDGLSLYFFVSASPYLNTSWTFHHI